MLSNEHLKTPTVYRLRCRSASTAMVLGAAAIVVAASALAEPVRTGHVTAELVAEQRAFVPGATMTVALRLDIETGWHTYWRNPGESGLPTTLAWRVPDGYSTGDIVWPAPRALPAGPLVNFGYEGEVLHLVPLTVPADARPGTDATLAARADWLVCRETCIPEGAELTLTLPVADHAEPDPRWHPRFAATREALPRPAPANWFPAATASGPVIALALSPPATRDPGRVHFFAESAGRIEPSSPQPATRGSDGQVVVQLPVAHDLAGGFERLQGVLTAERGFANGAGVIHAVALDVPLAGAPTPGAKPMPGAAAIDFGRSSAATPLSLPLALAFAFAGGLLLNLMPCVFPVLSLKALALASAPMRPRALRREAIAFAAGVIIAFALLGSTIVALRAAGEQLGWGFQLQSPTVVTALALLFFVMALNLSGVFEFGSLLPSRIASWSLANRDANAFASGLLAVAIASPCTAPFMGAALGYALGERSPVTLGVFVALGIGMALPYVALAWFPAWRRALPRPGPWMERLKQLLAFPLYATVAWLVWVLGAQVGNDAVMRIGATLVAVAFALWAWRAFRAGGRATWAGVALLGAIAGLFISAPLLGNERSGTAASDARTVAARAESDGWEPYSARRVTELTSEGRAVFIEFTAAWCITCQVNKRLVLTDPRVREAFARGEVTLLRADWTRRDPAITQALTALGRSGVPVYVLYRRGGEPIVFPEVLQRQALIDAIAS